MKLRLDSASCTGHGLCYSVAQHLITDDEHGYGQLSTDGEVPASRLAEARAAVANCPERAISLVEDSKA
ncbi:hypothetical protein MANY_41050 [Mycolicibacterium anyangense]|uniref:Ferredoxin n=1 Tax=Mycolicibacterium anyangense TaxID=1431246 RepID=A0A6N4WE35_9MYCO|nr:ferredoxin [Mycolicibacterium anyangense]BBZ78768.1 hypothetical protein MANY_41050 [Mycolicibacterium anyangense]